VLLVLTDLSGNHGMGEAIPHPAAPTAALATVRDDLARAAQWLRGAEASRLADLLAEAQHLVPPAAMAVDLALHDLVGSASGQPVAALLGGARRPAVAASALVADGDDAACAKVARELLARGFGTAKLKIGPDPARALARVATVRAAAPGLALRCDANGAWDAETAIDVARRLAALGVEWLEQPVPGADLTGLRRVHQSGGVTVAADEAVCGVASIPALAGAADVAVLKLVQLGGLHAAWETAAAAAAHGLRVTVTTGLETTIGQAAALHLAVALPALAEPCGLATGSLLAGDLALDGPADGPRMAPPSGPGLGVRLDPAAVARWCAD
jgi:L-alanine-DL-glutamate epimerase-like enolase superfamily enzyme